MDRGNKETRQEKPRNLEKVVFLLVENERKRKVSEGVSEWVRKGQWLKVGRERGRDEVKDRGRRKRREKEKERYPYLTDQRALKLRWRLRPVLLTEGAKICSVQRKKIKIPFNKILISTIPKKSAYYFRQLKTTSITQKNNINPVQMKQFCFLCMYSMCMCMHVYVLRPGFYKAIM